MKTIYANDVGLIKLGYQSENDRTEVIFDVSDLAAEFPGGLISVAVRRPTDSAGHLVTSITQNGNTARWLVDDYELEHKGIGEVQLIYSVPNVVAKTKIWKIVIERSLIVIDALPPDWQDIANTLLDAASQVKASVDSYDAMTAEATTLEPGSEVTAVIDRSGENPVLKLGIPKGQKGDKGDQGPRGEKGDKGDTYVLTEFDKKDISDLAFADLEAQKGSPNGIATLDDGGRIPAAQLPSFVDDVVEYGSVSLFPTPGETSKIYVATDTNKVYRWSGSQYTEMSESLALGDTAETAFAGNRGKAVEDAIATLSDSKADKSEIPEVPVQDVQINGASILSNGVANVPVASTNNVGVVKTSQQYGIANNPTNGLLFVTSSTSPLVKAGTEDYRPIAPKKQHESTFYGLAKAAGHDEKDSTNPVGTYTAEAKAAIQNMLDVPSKSDIPEVPVQDIQVNGTSVLQNGIANVPVASANTLGVIKADADYGTEIVNQRVRIAKAADDQIKQGTHVSRPITPASQHMSTFYGLAKASGDTTQSQSSNVVGTYTPEAKGAIQKMLGISDLIATEENDLTASKAYAIGDIFTANGKLYKATAAIAQDAAIILPDSVGANCEEVTVTDGFVKKTDVATASTAGIVKVDNANGIGIESGNKLYIEYAPSSLIKSGTGNYRPITPPRQHEAVFYGLAKAAGDTTQSASSNAVGQYTPEAKEAIQSMIGIDEGMFIVPVSGTDVNITAQGNRRYICGEVTSISITPPESGICDVIFTSGTSVAVLTATGVTWPEWFDPEALETETTYELNIANGRGVVCSWPSA